MKAGSDSVSPPPNFDHLLGNSSSQQQRQLNFQARHQGRSFHATKVPTKFDSAPRGNVRIHPTQMQRYVHGLMNQNGGGGKHNDRAQDMGAKAGPQGFMKGGSGGPSMGLSPRDAPFGKSASNSSSASASPSVLNRQKNDKAVEVHQNNRVIARFRTQTECARYLRATPEAVSYHCSKGGGVCNGLVIRPLGDKYNGEMPYGLFDGADVCRPKERPQLKPETVQILKDWLLSPEHMDNPYPNARETEMLMRRTGLDKTQLKHWFNNARKRILKPLLKNGGKMPEKKKRVSSGGNEENKKKPAKKKRKSETSDSKSSKKAKEDGKASPSLAMCGTVNSTSSSKETHKMSSNLTAREQDMVQQMQQESQQQGYAQGVSNGSEQGMTPNRYEMMMMRYGGGPSGQGNMSDMSMSRDMMMSREMMMRGYGDSYGRSSMQDPMAMMGGGMGGGMSMMGGGMGGGFPSSRGGGMAGFCMDANESSAYDRLNQDRMAEYPPRRLSTDDSARPGPSHQGFQDDQAYCRQASDGPADEDSRTNAVFKQQVATMAMNEASTAFKDMEDAFARAKDLMAMSRSRNPEDDPLVVEANERAKRLQGVAMFKLKVSQRASEEAAGAYDSYQTSAAGAGGGGGGRDAMMGMGRR